MSDVNVSWSKSPTAGVTAYSVVWTYNGTALAPVVVPQSAAGDTAGYSLLLSASEPSTTLTPGDTVSATVAAVGPGGTSTAATSTPPSVTVPQPVPAPPVNVTLSLV